MLTLVPVRVKDCSFHPDGHHVLMAPTISMEGGIAAERAMIDTVAGKYATDAERIRALTYAWAPIFVRFGAQDWDFCDDDGNPIPFDVEALLGDYSLARLVADKAGDLGYGSAVMAPFQTSSEKPSRNGRTAATTSPTRRRSRQ